MSQEIENDKFGCLKINISGLQRATKLYTGCQIQFIYTAAWANCRYVSMFRCAANFCVVWQINNIYYGQKLVLFILKIKHAMLTPASLLILFHFLRIKALWVLPHATDKTGIHNILDTKLASVLMHKMT